MRPLFDFPEAYEKMDEYRIRAELNPKPIPDRNHDWDAWIDGDEELGTGHGATKLDAMIDLCHMIELAEDRA